MNLKVEEKSQLDWLIGVPKQLFQPLDFTEMLFLIIAAVSKFILYVVLDIRADGIAIDEASPWPKTNISGCQKNRAKMH